MVKFDEYKGNPTIKLMRQEDEQYPFSFGYAKAKLIMDHLEEIKKFVEDCEAKAKK
jgi:hypothetical protein